MLKQCAIFFAILIFVGFFYSTTTFARTAECDACLNANSSNKSVCYIGNNAACLDETRDGCLDCLRNTNNNYNVCFGSGRNCGAPMSCNFQGIGTYPVNIGFILQQDTPVKKDMARAIQQFLEVPRNGDLVDCISSGNVRALSCSKGTSICGGGCGSSVCGSNQVCISNESTGTFQCVDDSGCGQAEFTGGFHLLCNNDITRLKDKDLGEKKVFLKSVNEAGKDLQLIGIEEVQKLACPSPKQLNVILIARPQQREFFADVQCCTGTDVNTCEPIDLGAKDKYGIPEVAKRAVDESCKASCRGNELANDPKYNCRPGVPKCCIGSQPTCLDYESAFALVQNFKDFDRNKPFDKQDPKWFLSTSQNILNLSKAMCGDHSSNPLYKDIEMYGKAAAAVAYAAAGFQVFGTGFTPGVGMGIEAATNVTLAIINCRLSA